MYKPVTCRLVLHVPQEEEIVLTGSADLLLRRLVCENVIIAKHSSSSVLPLKN